LITKIVCWHCVHPQIKRRADAYVGRRLAPLPTPPRRRRRINAN
jgi:hypothetical protein